MIRTFKLVITFALISYSSICLSNSERVINHIVMKTTKYDDVLASQSKLSYSPYLECREGLDPPKHVPISAAGQWTFPITLADGERSSPSLDVVLRRYGNRIDAATTTAVEDLKSEIKPGETKWIKTDLKGMEGVESCLAPFTLKTQLDETPQKYWHSCRSIRTTDNVVKKGSGIPFGERKINSARH